MDGKNIQCVRNSNMDFPGGPVVKTSNLHCREGGFDPWELNPMCSAAKKKKKDTAMCSFCIVGKQGEFKE